MASRYLLEHSLADGYLLEDGTGVLLLELDGAVIEIVLEFLVHADASGEFTVHADTAAVFDATANLLQEVGVHADGLYSFDASASISAEFAAQVDH